MGTSWRYKLETDMSGKNFDYGTGKKPKFKRVKGGKKRVKRNGAITRAANKFNKTFDYGASFVAAPAATVFTKFTPHAKHKAKRGILRKIADGISDAFTLK